MKNHIGHRDGRIIFATQSPACYGFSPPAGMTVIEVDDATYAEVAPTVGLLRFRATDSGFAPIPEPPTEFHTWDWVALAWIQDRARAEKSVRAKRQALLNATVDKINAVRWSAMNDADRSAWDAYRTALLDITDQSGFPFNVIWPSAPQ